MSPKDALEVAKTTARLFLSKHNERHSRDYVVLRSVEQDDGYLTGCYERIKRAMPTLPTPPMSAPREVCSRMISDGFTKQGREIYRTCTNLSQVWLVNQDGEPMIVAGSHCSECAAIIVEQWNSKFPDEPWMTTPIREYMHPDNDLANQPILIVGMPRERTHSYSDDNWYERFEVEVVPAQYDPRGFIYISSCRTYIESITAEPLIDKLISMLDEHQLDPGTANYYHPETPHWTVNPCTSIDNPEFNRSEPEDRITSPHYIDGDRIYQVDGVVRFDGNFITYSYGFCIDTNHVPTIERLQAAIIDNLARDWEAYNREKKSLINALCDYAEEPRKGEDVPAMIDRLLSAVTIVKAESVTDYLTRYYRQERMTDTLTASYEEELSRLGFVETSHFDSITGTHIAWPFYATAWTPTQCSEGATGRMSWRIIRHVLNADGSREFEYGSTDEKGVLEFVNREQAEAVAFSWRHPSNYTAAPPQSTYGFASGKSKSKSKKSKSPTTITLDFEDI